MEGRIYIFGAHSRAQTLASYLQYLYPDIEVEAYLYDNDEKNPEIIGNIPVIHLDGRTKLNTGNPVYIGTTGTYHVQVTKKLKKIGFQEIYPVTVEMDLKFRNAYLEKYFSDQGRDFSKIDMLETDGDFDRRKEETGTLAARVYVAQTVLDKPLQQEYALASYEVPIQVGADLTKARLHPEILTDNIGDNISKKNRQYCELTGMYWLWKHAKEDIIGLVHYRRHFLLPKRWEKLMNEKKIDVVLPTPLYVYPSIAENYMARHDASDWKYMLQYLREQDLSVYQMADRFFRSNLYSPCNMFIMKRNVLNELCEWLFPILNAVSEYGGEKADSYQNRYPGFLAERLITFYFEKNRHKYAVVYCDKNFLN